MKWEFDRAGILIGYMQRRIKSNNYTKTILMCDYDLTIINFISIVYIL